MIASNSSGAAAGVKFDVSRCTRSRRRAIASHTSMAWRGGALNVESTKSKCRTPASRASAAISSATRSGSRRR